jgi:S-adenosylmethionine/arginine decarboxylase-like enzyme
VDLLGTVAIVSLRQHDLLRHKFALIQGTEANDISNTGISVFVSVRNAHSSPHTYIETDQISIVVFDSDKAKIIREDINIVSGWNSHSDLKL